MTRPTQAPALKGALGRTEAAAYLDIGTSLFDDLRKAREIPELKIGSIPKWRIKDLDSFLERQVRRAAS